jgi:hypothetical protein
MFNTWPFPWCEYPHCGYQWNVNQLVKHLPLAFVSQQHPPLIGTLPAGSSFPPPPLTCGFPQVPESAWHPFSHLCSPLCASSLSLLHCWLHSSNCSHLLWGFPPLCSLGSRLASLSPCAFLPALGSTLPSIWARYLTGGGNWKFEAWSGGGGCEQVG